MDDADSGRGPRRKRAFAARVAPGALRHGNHITHWMRTCLVNGTVSPALYRQPSARCSPLIGAECSSVKDTRLRSLEFCGEGCSTRSIESGSLRVQQKDNRFSVSRVADW